MTDRGRSCPLYYRYRPEDLAASPGPSCEVLYVVGCLYGNTAALRAVLERAEREGATVVFSGDFHWLDTDPADFRLVAASVAAHHAILGNVEAELVSDDDNGCGCAYPGYVDDTTVALSNAIAETLARTAATVPDAVDPLRGLPRFLVADIAGVRVAILHGDPESLAGWRLALEAVDPADAAVRAHVGFTGPATTPADVADWFDRARVDVFACTHTGMPYAQDYQLPQGRRLVVNNGRAGMPNFTATTFGVATRLAADPTPPDDSLYGITLGGLRVDAVPVDYDPVRWERQFLGRWPPGSAAHRAYDGLRRHGGPLTVRQSARGSIATRP